MKILPSLILIWAIFANTAFGGEVLYNGIVLPDAWPPRLAVNDLAPNPPPLPPYLVNPPAVIPIDVGRQLFVDDFLIESTTLQRKFYTAEYYNGNPVLKPETYWETHCAWGPMAMAFGDGVWYDPQDNMYKMWYLSGYTAEMQALGYGTSTCLALSEDGIHWERPVFDVQSGSNIVYRTYQRDSATTWLDLEETNPAKRYKMFQFERTAWSSSVHYSADGIHWSGPTWTGPNWDRTTIFYNPFRRKWVYSIREQMNPGPWVYPDNPCARARKYWENSDLFAGASWGTNDPTWWARADILDACEPNPDTFPELYNLDSVAYESLMLGLFSIWYGSGTLPGQPKINEVMLGFSRDGFNWFRPYRQAIVTVDMSSSSAWNYGNVQSVCGGCLIVGDKLYIYESGRNNGTSNTGLAFMRRDGFASMDAGATEGQLTTRKVTFSGRYLFVNADADAGQLKAEVLDSNGNVISQFSKANCIAVSEDKTIRKISWSGGDDLSSLAGQQVRFKFYLTNGKLYSFWVSPEQSGASHGYVAAGGPGFTSSKDTVGIAAYQGIPLATNPNPPSFSGAGTVDVYTVLSWKAGVYAAAHDVYFGTDVNAVRDANSNWQVGDIYKGRQSANSYTPSLKIGITYYWRVDEVNTSHSDSPWKGHIWKFTTQDHAVVDNFNSYNAQNLITAAWGGNGVALETSIIHDGNSSMRIRYQNQYSPYRTETSREYTVCQNWSFTGAKMMSLWFRGTSDNVSEQIYVKIVDGDTPAHSYSIVYPDVTAVKSTTWLQWQIALRDFTGVNMANVKKIIVGLGDGINSGQAAGDYDTVYIDGIELYPPQCVEGYSPSSDINGDCVVDMQDLLLMAQDWLKTDYTLPAQGVTPNPAGLLAWWKFDGNFNDSSGHGYNAVSYGGASIINDADRGQVLRCDGVNDYADIPSAATLFSTVSKKVTFAMWAYCDVDAIVIPNTGKSLFRASIPTHTQGGTLNVNLPYFMSGGIPYVLWDSADSICRLSKIYNEWNGHWDHWAFTKDADVGTMKIFCNGTQWASNSGQTTYFTGINSMTIGKGWYGYFDGMIDDVRIYNYALNEQEVKYIMGEVYVALDSPANIYDQEPKTQKTINLKDFAILAKDWLKKYLWPSE